MAPLWGFLIAVTGRTDREEREAPPCRGQAPVPGASPRSGGTQVTTATGGKTAAGA
jgi:hypothetical protein